MNVQTLRQTLKEYVKVIFKRSKEKENIKLCNGVYLKNEERWMDVIFVDDNNRR